MKKIFSLFFALMPMVAFGQADLPYSKILTMSAEELIEAGFRYNKNKNQYILEDDSQGNMAANIAAAFTKNPYTYNANYSHILIQEGKEGIAQIQVTFHREEHYHELLNYAKNNYPDLIETKSENLTLLQFTSRVGLCQLEHKYERFKNYDNQWETYPVYVYTIDTGSIPDSPWHRKQAQKAEKKNKGGNISSLR